MIFSVDPGNGHPCVATWLFERLDACAPWQWGTRINPPEDCLVIEDQVIIPRFTKDPQSIIKLAHWSGALAREFGWPERTDIVRWVPPRSWKGGTKKPSTAKAWATYPIHQLVLRALTEPEWEIYETAFEQMAEGQRHDLADAVGLGLWHLGRLR